MKSGINGITRNILSLAVMSVPLTMLVLSACGGGGGGGGGVGGGGTLLMGGAIQGASLNLASATVSTLAGSTVTPASTLDGTGTAARFSAAYNTTTDGTNLYVVEGSCGGVPNNNDIRKIVIATGQVTTLAGSAVAAGAQDGTGTAATFNCSGGITTDGKALYVADASNNKIRKIAPSSGTLSAMTSANAVVTSLTGAANTAVTAGAVDGAAATASFNVPNAITTDGTSLYVLDVMNAKIRKITPSSGTLSAMTSANAVVTSLTGAANTAATAGAADGAGTSAKFNSPNGITTDGKVLYVADYFNNKIRKIAPSSGTLSAMTSANAVVTSLTGAASAVVTAGAADGAGTTASFNSPTSLTTDGTSLYVVDFSNNKIRKIAPSSGSLSAMTSANAVVSSLTGAANTAVTAGAVNGAAATASFNTPYDITTDGVSLYVVDTTNNLIRKIH